MNGLTQSQSKYDRRLPAFYDAIEEDEEKRDVTTLSTAEVAKITEQFIKELAKCEVLHNFMEDAGGAAGDLDEMSQLLAKAWVVDSEKVYALVGERFWEVMEREALSRWERNKD